MRCLESIRRYTTLPYKLVVVENNNKWLLEDEFDAYAYIPEGLTCAQNNNVALKLASTLRCDPLIVVSNDVRVAPGWLEAILETFQDPSCGVATLNSSESGDEPESKITEDFFGALWAVRNEVYMKVGDWDTQFCHSFDDADYWVRVYQIGYTIKMNRSVLILHKTGTTIYPLLGGARHDLFVKNRALFAQKHKGCDLPIFHKLK